MTDDFLHNLRTSHRQRFDRNRKPYDNPQYRKNDAINTRDRKSNFVRRGPDAEALGGFKKLMEGLLESQKTLTQAVQDMAEALRRQALALECIAGAMAGPQPVAALREADPKPAGSPGPVASLPLDPVEDLEPGDPSAQPPAPATAQAQSTEAVAAAQPMLAMIEELQNSGYSFEKIARHLEHHHVPTPSGRGHWRGALVSRIVKNQAVVAAAD